MDMSLIGSDFKRGDVVLVLDYPFGRPINVKGVVVGLLRDDFYNIKVTHGLRSGDIVKYKYWSLVLEEKFLTSRPESDKV